jgi:hypothetical protein
MAAMFFFENMLWQVTNRFDPYCVREPLLNLRLNGTFVLVSNILAGRNSGEYHPSIAK